MADYNIHVRSPMAVAEQKMTRVVDLLAGSSDEWGGVKQRPESYEDYAQVYKDIAWVHKCIAKVAGHCASRPIGTFQKRGKGKAAEEVDASDSELAGLLESVNKFENRHLLVSKTAMQLQITGNSYWGLERATEGGKPAEIWALRPDRVSIKPSKADYIAGYYYGEGETKKFFPPEDIVHFKLPNPIDDYYGLGLMSPALNAVILEYYSTAYNQAILRRTGTPGMMMSFKGQMSDEQKANLMRSWEKRHQGPQNAGKLVLVTGGETELQPFGFNPEQLQIQDLRKMNREEIATVFGVPPVVLGIYEDVNYATAAEQRKEYWSDTIIDYLRLIEGGINEFLAPQFDPSLFVRFETRTIEALQPDKKLESDRVCNEIDHGVITADEGRVQLGYEGEAPGGDTVWKPMNLVPVEAIGEESEAPAKGGKLFHADADNGNGVAQVALSEIAGSIVDRLPEGVFE